MGLQNSCLVTMPRDHRSEIKIFWVMSSRINLKSFDCCLCWKKWPIVFSDSEIQDKVGKLGVSVAMLIHLWERIAMILKVLVIPLKHTKGHSFWPFSFSRKNMTKGPFCVFYIDLWALCYRLDACWKKSITSIEQNCYSWSVFAWLKIATDTVTSASNIFSLVTKNFGLVASLVTRISMI